MTTQAQLDTQARYIELDTERKIRHRNKLYYRFNHWPIWIFVFFIAPGPLTFDLFEHGFDRANAPLAWRRADRDGNRRAPRPASRLRAGAVHHPLHGGSTEPALPACLLHDRVGRGGGVRSAEHRRARLRRLRPESGA